MQKKTSLSQGGGLLPWDAEEAGEEEAGCTCGSDRGLGSMPCVSPAGRGRQGWGRAGHIIREA